MRLSIRIWLNLDLKVIHNFLVYETSETNFIWSVIKFTVLKGNLFIVTNRQTVYKFEQLRGAYDKFPDFFFVWAFKMFIDSWKFSMLLLYILWDEWLISMISGLNEQLQQQLEYTLLKPDFHSWWISKMQSDNLEERYAIKFCFKRMEYFRLLL